MQGGITYCPVAETGTLPRRFFFHLMSAAGADLASETPASAEISVDGAAFTTTGVGTAVEIGDGWYYADLDSAPSEGFYVARWQPGDTSDAAAPAVNAIQVGGPIGDALARLCNEVKIDHAAHTAEVFDKGGVAGDSAVFTLTTGSGGSNKTQITRS